MVDVTHDEAVSILKATQETVVLTIEKNAIADVTGSKEVSSRYTDIRSASVVIVLWEKE